MFFGRTAGETKCAPGSTCLHCTSAAKARFVAWIAGTTPVRRMGPGGMNVINAMNAIKAMNAIDANNAIRFAQEAAKLRSLIDGDLKKLEQALDQAGAPWTVAGLGRGGKWVTGWPDLPVGATGEPDRRRARSLRPWSRSCTR